MKTFTPEQEKNLNQFALMGKIADNVAALCESMEKNPETLIEDFKCYLVGLVNKRMTGDFRNVKF